MPFIIRPHGPQYEKKVEADDVVCVEYRNYVLAPSNGGVEIWELRSNPVKVIPGHFGPNNVIGITDVCFREQIQGSIEDAKHFIDVYYAE